MEQIFFDEEEYTPEAMVGKGTSIKDLSEGVNHFAQAHTHTRL